MLRITRQMRRRLMGEGNLRKYLLYATGEVVLIIIGIFLALQLNNCNQERKDRKVEINAYREIQDDLVKTLADVEKDRLRHRRHLDDAVRLRAMLFQPQSDNRLDSIGLLLKSTARDYQLYPKVAAFEALKSRGLETLTRDSLRLAITDLYQLGIDNLTSIGREESAVRNMSRIMEPHLARHLVLTPRISQRAVLAPERDTISYFQYQLRDYDAMLQDERLLNDLESVIEIRVFKLQKHDRLQERIRGTLRDIERELDRLTS